MKKFVIKSIFFFGIIAFGVVAINKWTPKNKNLSNYIAAIIDKHKRLEQIQTPKIIFAGGSNLAFGLDSEKIENKFSIPIVNLGLHAGLGLSFMLEELKYSVKKGDVVFISPEYFLEEEGDYRLKKKSSGFYKPAALFYDKNSVDDFNLFIENSEINLKNIFDSKKIKKDFKIYSRESFNEYGDVVGHLKSNETKKLNDKSIFKYRNWEGINLINNFNEFAKKKNISVYFLYPDFLDSEYYKNKTVLDKLQIDLEKNLEIKIINSPNDFIFEKSFFFDTVYHLNKKGRNERTKKMIKIIENYIPKNPKSKTT